MWLHCNVRVCISFDKTFKDQSQMAVLFPMKNNHTKQKSETRMTASIPEEGPNTQKAKQ